MPQNILVALRGSILAYLVATGAMIVHYKLNVEESAGSQWRHLFDFALVSHLLVFVYHVLAFVGFAQPGKLLTWLTSVVLQSWTFTHLYHPDPDQVRGGVESWIVRAMSLPRNMASLRKQFYFTMFYTTATCFALMSANIYWNITRPYGPGSDGPPELLAGPALNANATNSNLMPDAPCRRIAAPRAP